jgi:hypothetical protein
VITPESYNIKGLIFLNQLVTDIAPRATVAVSTEAELRAAVVNAVPGVEEIIQLMNDITLVTGSPGWFSSNAPIVIPAGKIITLTGAFTLSQGVANANTITLSGV